MRLTSPPAPVPVPVPGPACDRSVSSPTTSCAPTTPSWPSSAPPAPGKTELSLQLAARLDAEIVNCDSRQVYRGLDIGSAKPSGGASAARVPHHLFDVVDPDQPFDCARYRELARAAIADIRARGKRVVLVGGTGLYLKVLRYGLFAGAAARRGAARAACGARRRRARRAARTPPPASTQPPPRACTRTTACGSSAPSRCAS